MLDKARLLDRTGLLVAVCNAAARSTWLFREANLPQAIGHLLTSGADGSAALATMTTQLSVPGHPATVLRAALAARRASGASPPKAAVSVRSTRAGARGQRGRRIAVALSGGSAADGQPDGDLETAEALAQLLRALAGLGELGTAAALLPRMRGSAPGGADGQVAARLLQSVADTLSEAGHATLAQELQREVQRIGVPLRAPAWAPAPTFASFSFKFAAS